MVRKTRFPSAGSAATAAGSESAHTQPGSGGHPGRRSTTSGTPAVADADTACAVIVDAKGCVASTTAATPCSRSQAASPSTPPKPPIRTSPDGQCGVAHPPGQRRHHVDTGADQGRRERPGLGGAAEDQDRAGQPAQLRHRASE